MYRMRCQEFGRLFAIFRFNCYLYSEPLIEYHLKMGVLDNLGPGHIHMKWDDASLTVNYFLYVMERINKYGLQYGPINQRKFPDYENSIKEEEDKLTEYFLYEMRKEPGPEKTYPDMPII